MEAVKVFNSELAGLYECKPPISKAKMTAITKAAIRAIKFYKHVVQSVEKFIQKCKTEYKIPGLYVIDSIVRQSRHQFSIEKDVFAPRFAKNITVTFYYLFKCPQEDKSKVIRVLNLWQKNHVFTEDVIQPLFDLADPNHSIHKEVGNLIAQKANKTKTVPVHHTPQQQTPQYQHTPQYSQVSQAQQQQILHSSQQTTTTTSTITNAAITAINDTVANVSNQESVGATTSVVSSLDPNLIHQIQQILMKTEEGTPVASAVAALSLQAPHAIPAVSQSLPQIPPPVSLPPLQTSTSISLSVPPLHDNNQGLLPRVPPSDYDGRNFSFLPVDTSQPPPGYHPTYPVINKNKVTQPSIQSQPLNLSHSSTNDSIIELHSEINDPKSPREEGEHSDDSENKENQDDVIECDRRHRSRSRSLSRSKRNKRRSRSLSNSRSRHRRSRSRSRNRRSRSRERDRERRDRERTRRDREKEKINYEKERERKKRGLPPMKNELLSICSTTLWVGHLSKLVHQEELSDTFGEYGDIVSIDLIPPRGCAFICMNRRQDAARALIKLKNHKMHNKAITLAWAPGKGVKGKEFKDFWEVDVGCSYIPFSKLSQLSNLDLDSFEDGGMIDEETVPSWLKGRYGSGESSNLNVSQNPTHSHLPPSMVNMGIPPPISSRQERPPPQQIPTAPPPLNKDQREENRTGIPPPLLPPFAMQNMPPPGGIPMGASIIPSNMPPSLPPPIGVPPPMAIPPLNVPPSSNMLGQPLIRIPPHISPAASIHPPPIGSPSLVNSSRNSIATHDSENMDVEMEDVHKQDTLIRRTPPIRESIGVAEFMESVSKRELEFEFENSSSLEAKKREGEGNKNSNELDKRKLSAISNTGNEFRNEGFGTFGPGALPIHRAPPPFTAGPVGIIPRNGPNFVGGPRSIHPFNAQRGILPAPPPLIGSRPNILSDIPIGSHGLLASGIGGPRPVGLRPGRIIVGSVQNPRGIGAPIVNRFGAPNFPRFGVISGPRQLSLHPSPLDEEQGEWNNPPTGIGRYMKIHPIDENLWNPDEDLFSRRNRMDKEMTIVSHQRVEELVRKEDSHIDPLLSRNTHHQFDGESSNARIMNDKFLNGGMRHCDEDKEKERFRESERDWDRSRDRDWDRSKDRNWERDRERSRGKEWERERGRERDRNRDRDRERDRENDRWRSRERERDRDRERDFNRYNNDKVDRYGGDNRSKEKSFERLSRWSCDSREEKREDKMLKSEDLNRSDDPSEETMTWDNWATFSNFNVPQTSHKNTEVDSLSNIHEPNKNDNRHKKCDIQNFSSPMKDFTTENKPSDTENKLLAKDNDVDKPTNKDFVIEDGNDDNPTNKDFATEDNTVNKPTDKDFVPENKLVTKDDNVDKPTNKNFVNEDDNVDKVTNKDFVSEDDNVDKPTSKDFVTEDYNVDKPTNKDFVTEDYNVDKPTNKDFVTEDYNVDKPTNKDFVTEDYNVDKPTNKDFVTEDDNVDKPTNKDFETENNLFMEGDNNKPTNKNFETENKLVTNDDLIDKLTNKDRNLSDEISSSSSIFKMDNSISSEENCKSLLSNNTINEVNMNLESGKSLETNFVKCITNNPKSIEVQDNLHLTDKKEINKYNNFSEVHSKNIALHLEEKMFIRPVSPVLNQDLPVIIDDNIKNDTLHDKILEFEINMENNDKNNLSDNKENFKETSVVKQNESLQLCLENASNNELSKEDISMTDLNLENSRQDIKSADFLDDTKHILNKCHVDNDSYISNQCKKDDTKCETERLNITEPVFMTNLSENISNEDEKLNPTEPVFLSNLTKSNSDVMISQIPIDTNADIDNPCKTDEKLNHSIKPVFMSIPYTESSLETKLTQGHVYDDAESANQCEKEKDEKYEDELLNPTKPDILAIPLIESSPDTVSGTMMSKSDHVLPSSTTEEVISSHEISMEKNDDVHHEKEEKIMNETMLEENDI